VIRKLCNSQGTGGIHIMLKISLVKAWLWRPKASLARIDAGAAKVSGRNSRQCDAVTGEAAYEASFSCNLPSNRLASVRSGVSNPSVKRLKTGARRSCASRNFL
jgi:hypothetical protein